MPNGARPDTTNTGSRPIVRQQEFPSRPDTTHPGSHRRSIMFSIRIVDSVTFSPRFPIISYNSGYRPLSTATRSRLRPTIPAHAME
ncbi:uncharacterized protein ATNIH1004_009431, partial [Aspergillus tanneri]